jgi:hypothetical protein
MRCDLRPASELKALQHAKIGLRLESIIVGVWNTDFIVQSAIPMIAHHVLNPQLRGRESRIASLAMGLCVVLLESSGACKVEVASVTEPVGAGSIFVLL